MLLIHGLMILLRRHRLRSSPVPPMSDWERDLLMIKMNWIWKYKIAPPKPEDIFKNITGV